MIRIAFYKGRHRWINRLISWWTKGPYSHVEVVVEQSGFDVLGDGGLLGEVRLSEVASSSLLDGGVRIKAINLNPDHWDIIEVDGSAQHARSWFEARVGAKYDFLGVLGFILRIIGHDQKRWFCSEAVAASLGFIEPWRFNPNSLHAVLRGVDHG